MLKTSQLFSQVARPLLLGAALLGVGVLFAVTSLLDRSLTREVEHAAGILTRAAESLPRAELSAAELADALTTLSPGQPRLAGVAVVDLDSERVLAARGALGASGAAALLNPLLRGASSWTAPGAAGRIVAKPLRLAGYGHNLWLVLRFDGGALAAANARSVSFVMLLVVLGVMCLAMFAAGVLRVRIVEPILAINAAVEIRRRGISRAAMPQLGDDEIGQLARLLESSLAEIEQLDDRLRVLSQAIQGSNSEVYIIDGRTLEVLFANRAAQRSLGYSQEELLALSAPDVAPALADPACAQDLLQQLNDSEELRHCYEHRRRGGETYPFEFNVSRVRQNDRTLLIVIGNDVSERELKDAALRVSEERLNLAVEGSNDGVFDYDVRTGALYVSDRVREWLALPPDVPGEAQLDLVFQRLEAEDLPRVRAAFRDCMADGKDFDVEFRYRLDGDHGRWLQVRGRGTSSTGQAPDRLIGFVSDVSRRKTAESLLHDSVARLGAVLDNIAEGIVTLDGDGLVCAVNRAGEQMLGCDRDTLVAQPFRERLEIPATGWRGVADRQPRECLAVCASGETFAAEYSVSGLDIGSDERFIVVFRDISERRRADEELRRALEETEAATRAKDEFLATMSHEIRTPMNGVLGMTQLLLDMDLNPEQQETAQVIHSSAEALLTIINDILDFSKIVARKVTLEAVPFNLRAAIDEVMELLAAGDAEVDLYVDYPVDAPSHLVGDLGRVRQVLMNLIGNALKFTEAGHVAVIVRDLSAPGAAAAGLRSFARLEVAITDTGPGIALETQAQLFESFTQADASTTRRYGGTGLGLAISKRLVELMGGEIGLRSQPGHGSTFFFALNLPTYFEDMSERVPQALAGRSVLVVHESEFGRSFYRRALADAAMRVEVVADPGAALDALSRTSFETVLLHEGAGQIDLEELARELRLRLPDVKLLRLTRSESQGSDPSAHLDSSVLQPVARDRLYRLLTASLGLAEPRPAQAKAPRRDGPTLNRARRRVLVAEDNVVNQKVAVRMLEKLGCTVDVAANGREALEMWEQFPYALVFMDCQMPEMDGLEATRQIRQLELVDGQHTPVIAMTANAMPRDADECLAAGMDDYLAKPVKTAQLEAALERWCPSLPPGPGPAGGEARPGK